MDRRTAAVFACYRLAPGLTACRTLWYSVVSMIYVVTSGSFGPSAPPQVQPFDFIACSPFAPCYNPAASAYPDVDFSHLRAVHAFVIFCILRSA